MRRVVVTGMGAVTPLGNHLEETWNGMAEGRRGIDFITKFDTEAYKVKVGAEVKDFDPLEHFEKSEIRKNDLFTQYAVSAAEEAIRDSGLSAQPGEENISPERLGVYVGSGIGGINTIVTETNKLYGAGKRVSPFMVPMMIGNMAAGTISIRCNAQGPTLPVVTACATSSHTIGEAFRAIKHGYADAILAGGAEAAVCPLAVSGFTSCMALTTNPDPATACTPFDKRRSGFVIGEGAAVLVLEEYEHAKARGAHIYGEICGYGNTADAYHVTAPHPEGAGIIRAIRLALEEAGETPEQQGAHTYINAHGTSTPLNDKTETMAFKAVFGEKARSIAISSTKSMTGHMLGAAGAVEAIASVLAVKEGIVPPTIGYQQPDPECDLDYVPNEAREAQIDLALSASLGFGGHNAYLAFRRV